MPHIPFPIPASSEATPPAVPGATRSYRRFSLRSLIASWREKNRFQIDLERKLQGDPHVLDDVGLTRRQVEDELARPFWHVL
ncbi:MAG TPA: DUF1127 domain-containing protein [Ensifer sp.]|uniref:DUF1127 domain-containing protein n=1 Tax=Ensifer sp. TaxID=1872086 RepID=UPI002E12CE74|nr:DUF1127 domain-containing protein [Ensifer sp.]